MLLRTTYGWAGFLTDLAEHLAPSDRALILGVYERGMTATAFARAIDRRPNTICRRVRRLIQRMTAAEFRFVIEHRRSWPPWRRHVAETVILRGMSQRRAARELGASVYQVRRELEHVRVLMEAGIGADSGTNRLAS